MTDLALVTGASGFVGSALCRALIESGLRVRALHRPSSNLQQLIGLPVERFEGDILEPETMQQACRDVRWVYHAASQSAYWRHPESVRQTAIEGTRNVAQAALDNRVERFVFTSSVSALGVPNHGELLTEDHHFNLPENRFPYGAAKHQAERTLLDIIEGGLDAVIVNPSLILGPGDLNLITGSMVVEAARGWGFFYLDGGMNYVHIEDVAQGHLTACRLGERGKRYILGGENLTHHEAFSILTEVVGRRRPWLKIPRFLVRPAAWMIERMPRSVKLPFDANQLRVSRHHVYCDIAPSRAALNLGDPISFRQSVEDTYRWYVEIGLIKRAKTFQAT